MTTVSGTVSAAVSDRDFPNQMGMRAISDAGSQNFVRHRSDNDQIEICKAKVLQNLKQFDDDALIVDCKNKSQFLQTRSQRGSRYRGVSKNGGKWQVRNSLRLLTNFA